jgi:CRP-like cAMP-binding protein
MTKPKSRTPLTSPDLVDWTGVALQQIQYEPAATIFAQGDPATSVMYVESGAVRSQSCRTPARKP